MGMPDTARRYTVDEVLAFPDDGNRYELVDGELLVTPAPALKHQIVISELALAIGQASLSGSLTYPAPETDAANGVTGTVTVSWSLTNP